MASRGTPRLPATQCGAWGLLSSPAPGARCLTPVALTAPALTVRQAARHDTSPPLRSLHAAAPAADTELYQAGDSTGRLVRCPRGKGHRASWRWPSRLAVRP